MATGDGGGDFGFPFTPYASQQTLMRGLHEVLEESNVAVFESPTGTGKSLSVICSAFHWLLENENTVAASKEEAKTQQTERGKAMANEPDWVRQFVQQEKEDKKRDEEKEFAQTKVRVAKLEERSSEFSKRKKPSLPGAGEGEDADLLVDVDEQDEAVPTWKRLLLEAEDDSDGPGKEHEDADADDRPKIIYCSRTHSQLSQFVKEIGKTPYRDKIRCVSLGSRKNLCVNDDVQRLKSSTAMTDKCLDLQDGKGKGDKGVVAKKARVVGGRKSGQRAPAKSACPFLEKKSQNIMRDYIVSDIRDIEQIAQKGRSLGACAYYGTRKAVPSAHVLCIPYPSLLHRKSREALGIKLKNAVVIIDEAHNLMETINDIYSVTVSIECITGAHHQLTEYLERYKLRLKPSNTQYVKQLLFILQKLQRFLSTAQEKKRKPLTATPYGLANEQSPIIDSEIVEEETSMMTVNDLVFEAKIDTINIFSLLAFIEKSELTKKLRGFAERYQGEDIATNDGAIDAEGHGSRTHSSLQSIADLLASLTNDDQDGRILLTRAFKGGKVHASSSVGFVMMNPCVNFKEIVEEARSVVLLGGTMRPFSHFVDQLFLDLPAEKVKVLACPHVVPPENVLAVSLSAGPTGTKLSLTYQHRGESAVITELARVLLNVCSVVPEGVVCFFPSYAYMNQVVDHWKGSGLLAQLQRKKPLLSEPRNPTQQEGVWKAYQGLVASGRGAILTCVVGGKMSEGINFSDGLARCVVMIGLPYANPHDAQLKEKMKYLDATLKPKTEEASTCAPRVDATYLEGLSPGAQYYECLCMRAVNQCIGRAIRHKDDFASIVLVDCRYEREEVRSQLPDWVQARLQKAASFSHGFRAISSFFAAHRQALRKKKEGGQGR